METAKSTLLILLVLTSLALSYLLWYGSPPYEVSRPIESEQILFSGTRRLSELVTPDRVVYAREEGVYHIVGPGQELYQSAFTFFKNTLPERSAWKEVAEEESAELGEGGGIRLDFLYPYPVKIEADQASETPSLHILKFFIPLSGEEAWLETGEGLYFAPTPEAARRELLQRFSGAEKMVPYRLLTEADLQLEENVTFTREIFLPEIPLELPSRIWQREALDMERLLRVFFIDMSLVRRIEEKDGAFIYTDGQKGVRVYPNGAVEYTTAGGRDSLLAGPQAVSMAGEIIALYGGWTANLYLWPPPGPRPLSEQQQIFFIPHFAGKPLVSPEVGISLSVTNRGAQSFFRNLMVPSEEPAVTILSMPADEAFQLALDYALQELGGDRFLEIRGFYPGYYMREPFFEPQQAVAAWFLELDGRGLAVINAVTGSPMVFLQF